MGGIQKERASDAWSGRGAFILAAVGSAVGLGNIWKFPYMAGANGGGAFVLIYLIAIAFIGVPIFLAELYIGQTSRRSAVQAFEALHRKKTPWRWVGAMGVFSGFVILSFYSVVGGWVLDFEIQSLLNRFGNQTPDEIKGYMGTLFGNASRQVFFHLIFMLLCLGIILGGVRRGIERWTRLLMPALCVLLLLLLIYSVFQSGFSEALKFLFYPDFSALFHESGKFKWAVVLEAVGHAFFTLSLGLGCIITYGSYLNDKKDFLKIAVTVALLDTVFALVAGVIIFSVVFSHGLEPGGGPTLLFQTLPVLFSEMPGGYFVSVTFFMLVSFAAITSGISLLEVVTAYLVDNFKFGRRNATIFSSSAMFFVGLLTVFSMNVLSEYKFGIYTFFDLKDKLTSNITLPLGGLLISLFYGWVLGPRAVEASIGRKAAPLFLVILWITRLAAPIAVGIILFNGTIELAEGLFK